MYVALARRSTKFQFWATLILVKYGKIVLLWTIEVLQNNILDWGTGAQDVVIVLKTYLVVPKRTTQESYSFAKLSIAADQKKHEELCNLLGKGKQTPLEECFGYGFIENTGTNINQ